MTAKLDKDERSIERSASGYRPVFAKRRKKVESVLARARKTRNINIRISEETLAELKKRSEQEGLPYQTLISSVLHKYLKNRLVDEDAINKAIELLRSAR